MRHADVSPRRKTPFAAKRADSGAPTPYHGFMPWSLGWGIGEPWPANAALVEVQLPVLTGGHTGPAAKGAAEIGLIAVT